MNTNIEIDEFVEFASSKKLMYPRMLGGSSVQTRNKHSYVVADIQNFFCSYDKATLEVDFPWSGLTKKMANEQQFNPSSYYIDTSVKTVFWWTTGTYIADSIKFLVDAGFKLRAPVYFSASDGGPVIDMLLIGYKGGVPDSKMGNPLVNQGWKLGISKGTFVSEWLSVAGMSTSRTILFGSADNVKESDDECVLVCSDRSLLNLPNEDSVFSSEKKAKIVMAFSGHVANNYELPRGLKKTAYAGDPQLFRIIEKELDVKEARRITVTESFLKVFDEKAELVGVYKKKDVNIWEWLCNSIINREVATWQTATAEVTSHLASLVNKMEKALKGQRGGYNYDEYEQSDGYEDDPEDLENLEDYDTEVINLFKESTNLRHAFYQIKSDKEAEDVARRADAYADAVEDQIAAQEKAGENDNAEEARKRRRLITKLGDVVAKARDLSRRASARTSVAQSPRHEIAEKQLVPIRRPDFSGPLSQDLPSALKKRKEHQVDESNEYGGYRWTTRALKAVGLTAEGVFEHLQKNIPLMNSSKEKLQPCHIDNGETELFTDAELLKYQAAMFSNNCMLGLKLSNFKVTSSSDPAMKVLFPLISDKKVSPLSVFKEKAYYDGTVSNWRGGDHVVSTDYFTFKVRLQGDRVDFGDLCPGIHMPAVLLGRSRAGHLIVATAVKKRMMIYSKIDHRLLIVLVPGVSSS